MNRIYFRAKKYRKQFFIKKFNKMLLPDCKISNNYITVCIQIFLKTKPDNVAKKAKTVNIKNGIGSHTKSANKFI